MIDNERLSIDSEYPHEYNLQIRDVEEEDADLYVCTIASQPLQSYEYQLTVQSTCTLQVHNFLNLKSVSF